MDVYTDRERDVGGCETCNGFIAIIGQKELDVVGCKDVSMNVSNERACIQMGSSMSRPCHISLRQETREQECLHCPNMVKVCCVVVSFSLSGAPVCEGILIKSCGGAQIPSIAYFRLFSGTVFWPSQISRWSHSV
jgi:hypothetical protein